MRKTIEKFYQLLIRGLFIFFGQLPKKEQFFFESFHGKQYSDNPRAIYEYLTVHYPEMKSLWAVKKGFEAPFMNHSVPFVPRLGLRWVYEMARSKYWVFNTRMPDWMVKTKGTTYVQTWHGTPLKRLGLDIEQVAIPGTNTKAYQDLFMKESKRWDVLLSPNAFSSNAFRSAFGYTGKILENGYPRNDLLIKESHNNNKREQIRKKLGIKSGKKVVLYAPTWRDNQYHQVGAYKYEPVLPIEEILAKNPDIVLLLRLHYLVTDKPEVTKYDGRVIDCSSYEDIQDLYILSDLLVTDYSSVMFDYAYTRRPMLFYMYDYASYAEQIRGFYFDPQAELPGPIVHTKEELVRALQEIFTAHNHVDLTAYESFINKYCQHPAQASEKLLKYLMQRN